MAKNQKQRVVVNRESFIRLIDWLKPQGKSISLTQKQIAAAATKELGVPITPSAVRDALGILGITIVDPRGGNFRVGDRTIRLAKAIKAMIDTLGIANDMPKVIMDDLHALTVRRGEANPES